MAENDIEYSGLLNYVIGGNDLSGAQAYDAFTQIMDGQWYEAQIAALLVALATKGETIEEIAGAARAMRDHAVKIDAGGMDVVDTCGTGGTGLRTFNISTASAMVLAGAGAKVAKHGNRTNTRASGSADVLAELGVNLDADEKVVAQCLKYAGVCFCFAMRCHPAMRHAGPVRKALGVRTVFNVLGPLTNPAGAKRQIMGVFDTALTEKIARVLGLLGAEHALVVHAADGLDEISITCETQISQFKDGQVTTQTIRPEDFGVPGGPMGDLLVESPAASAEMIRGVLGGKAGPPRNIVLLNAAAGLIVAGIAPDMTSGVEQAAKSIDSGAAAEALEKLVLISSGS